MTAQIDTVPKTDTVVSSVILYRPVHLTHVAVSAIWATAIISITAIVFYFQHTLTASEFFFLVLGWIGIAVPNAYYLTKLSMSQKGMSETTSK